MGSADNLQGRSGSLYNPFELDYHLLAVDLVEHFHYHYTRKDWRDKLRDMNVRGDSIAPVLEYVLNDDDWNNQGFREGTHYYIPNNQWGSGQRRTPACTKTLRNALCSRTTATYSAALPNIGLE